MTAFWAKLHKLPWIWSFIAAALVWLITIAYTGGQGAGEILTAALSFATFTIIAGLGQMLVITTGPGNVDLSIPATITLSGVVAMKVMDTDPELMVIGILAALGASLLVGIFNYFLIRLLRIPPIIATLSSSFLILSTAISYGRGIRIKPPPPLAEFATMRVLGVPVAALFVILISILIALILKRAYGDSNSVPIQIDLPETSTPAGVIGAVAAIVAAVSKGEISPAEASDLTSIVDAQRRAIELGDHEARLQRLEASTR